MFEPKVVHATCVVERTFAKPLSVVYAALSDPHKVRRWMSGGSSSDLFDFQCDFVEGGKQLVKYRMGPDTPIAGAVITNEGRFQHIIAGERIVTVSTMKMDERIFSASQVTYELVNSDGATRLVITHQGAFFEGSDGPERREQGWNRLADNLTSVIEEA